MPGIKAAPPPAELPDLPELPTSPRTARAGSRNVFSFRPIANRFQKPRISEDELTGVKPNSFRSDMRSTTLAHIGSHRSIVATYSDILTPPFPALDTLFATLWPMSFPLALPGRKVRNAKTCKNTPYSQSRGKRHVI